MTSLIAALIREHREIEAGLDQLAGAITGGQMDAGMFLRLAVLTARHYSHEAAFLNRLQTDEPRLASKLNAQHDEASEIAARLNEALAAGEMADVPYLSRRFVAIAQHNIIEEERDVFPLAERLLSEDQAEEPGPA